MPLTIHRNVDGAKLPRILPRPFAKAWRKFQLTSPATILIFDDKVVRLSAVHRALKKLAGQANARLVFVGRDFTAEVRALVLERDATLLDLTHFGWTEASELDIRVSIGAAVKRPR